MKWYNNLNVAAKLIIGFALVIGLAAYIGISGRVSLRETRLASDEIFQNYGNSQGYLGFVINYFQEDYSAMADALIYDTDEDIEESLAIIVESNEYLDHYMAAYKDTCVSDEDFTEYAHIEENLAEYLALVDQFVTSAQARDKAAAMEVFTSDAMSDISSALSENLAAAALRNVEEAETVQGQLNASTVRTENIMLAVMCASLLMAVLSVYYVASSIGKPLRGLMGAAQKLAAGDLNVDCSPYLGKNETGRLAYAFNDVVESLNRLIGDTKGLVQASLEGRLSTRAGMFPPTRAHTAKSYRA